MTLNPTTSTHFQQPAVAYRSKAQRAPWNWLCQAAGDVPLGGSAAAAQGGTNV